MYINLSSGKSVQIVGPFRDLRQFLEWAEQEKITKNFRIMGENSCKNMLFSTEELKRQLEPAL